MVIGRVAIQYNTCGARYGSTSVQRPWILSISLLELHGTRVSAAPIDQNLLE